MQPRNRSDDNSARFLNELRALRDLAGLHHADLAARAHYPSEVLRAAEAGPGLPDLPVLSAYVRACGGEVTDWEDRWRALTGSGGPESLPMRPTGSSAAAAAGARAGATVSPPDEHDPAHIMAVLARASETPGAVGASSAFGASDASDTQRASAAGVPNDASVAAAYAAPSEVHAAPSRADSSGYAPSAYASPGYAPPAAPDAAASASGSAAASGSASASGAFAPGGQPVVAPLPGATRPYERPVFSNGHDPRVTISGPPSSSGAPYGRVGSGAPSGPVGSGGPGGGRHPASTTRRGSMPALPFVVAGALIVLVIIIAMLS